LVFLGQSPKRLKFVGQFAMRAEVLLVAIVR
jgi:hypothetical protein